MLTCWIEMDRALAAKKGLHVESRTTERDLALFRKFGQRTVPRWVPGNSPTGCGSTPSGVHVRQFYQAGVRPLFSANEKSPPDSEGP